MSANQPNIYILRYKQSFLRRLLPVQSFTQFAVWALIDVVVFLLAKWIIQLTNEYMPDSLLVIGVVAGSIPSLMLATPGSLTIINATPAALQQLEQGLFQQGYRPAIEDAPGRKIFEHRLPAWLKWDESTIRWASSNNEVVIEGPYALLKRLKGRAQQAS